MKQYYTLLPKVRSRLSREVFTQATEGGDRRYTTKIGCENHFNSVRTALWDLYHNQHFATDQEFGLKLSNFVTASYKLLSSEDIDKLYSKKQQEKIKHSLVDLKKSCEKFLNTDFRKVDIVAFIEVCERGRRHFKAADYDPNEFIAKEQVDFAKMIIKNFQAYDQTLNYKYFMVGPCG